MWRGDGDRSEELAVGPDIAITIPVGTSFQLRANGPDEPLAAIGVTIPPWPGDGEAIRCEGRWPATVAPGPGLAQA